MPLGLKVPEFKDTTPEIQQLEGQMRGEQQALEKRIAPMQEQRASLETEIKSDIAKPFPQAPQLQKVPEFQPRKIDSQELWNFGTIATALAALGSALTRTGLTGMLNAAGKAMEGFQNGRLEQADLELKQFRTHADSVMKHNEELQREYTNIIESRKLNLSQKMSMLQMIATREKDEIGLAQIKMKNLRGFLDLQQKRIDNFNKFELQITKMESMFNAQMARMAQAREMAMLRMGMGQGTVSGLSSEAIDNAASFLILNSRLPMGLSRMGPGAVQAIQNRAAEIMGKMGLSAMDFAAIGPITRQKLGALLQLEKMRNGVQAYEQMLDLNVGILKELSAKVNRTDSPYANKPILWLQQNAAGDPDVAEYLFQVRTVQTEAARILANPNLTGQLTDTATQELANVFGANLSVDQLQRVATRAQKDAQNRSATLDRQVEKLMAEVRDPLHRSDPTAVTVPTAKPKEGDKSVSKSGRPIIFQGGSWVYGN